MKHLLLLMIMIMCCFTFHAMRLYLAFDRLVEMLCTFIYFVNTDLLTLLIFFIWHFKLLIITF